MGSHSTEAKRRKRKAQKKKKRALKHLKYQGDSSQSTADHESSTLDELGTLSESADHSPLKESHELCACHSEEDLFTLLDRVAERFWEEIEPEIRQLESYRDAHPSLVLDQDRYIEVFVGGDSQDLRGLLRVSTEEYFARMHRRETKAMALCRTLRNRIESLEKDIEAGRQKMVTVHKEKKSSCKCHA